MARVRVGVALLVPPPHDRVIDAWRLALGDPALGRIPPHLTLVPPVNVRVEDLPAARRVLERAAAATRPFTLEIGPPSSFLPVNPVVFLPVVSDPAPVHAIRDRVFVAPLERALTWPFVPHVTVADDAPIERVHAAVHAMVGARLTVTFDRVHLLEEGEGRVWSTRAEVAFGASGVVGRGGLETELQVASRSEADVREFSAREWALHERTRYGAERAPSTDVVIAARRGGEVVACAEGWVRAERAHLADLIVGAAHRREGIGRHVLAAFESAAAERGAIVVTLHTERDGPAETFYAAHGWRRQGTIGSWPWADGATFVQLEKRLA